MRPEIILYPTARQIIEADNERMKEATKLAACQLGIMPDVETDYERYVDFLAQHNDLAREILGRPI